MGEVIKLRVASSQEAITLQSASGSLAVEAVSPRVSFEKVEGGTRLDITDIDGTKSAILPDGAMGPIGPSGATGPAGIGIVSCELLQDYRLMITYSNGTYDIVGPIRGAQGEIGPIGPSGTQGPSGVGIVYCELLQDYRLQITYSNGTYDIVGPIRGPQGDPGDDYTLTSADKYEIAGLAITPTAFPAVTVQTAGRVINYSTGSVNVRSGYNASKFVDISAYPAIRYSRAKTAFDTLFAGIAFYDSEQTFITGTGIPSLINQSALGYVLHDVAVPTGAKYARFTMFADTQTYGAFELYGIPAAMWELEQKQDALTFDSAPTSGSTNPVISGGVYTAIQAKADPVTVETVSGTDPVIVGIDNHRYVCGTCDTLTLTPPASGIVDVVFTSGTTPTVLSVPSSVRWPGWFDPSALDASVTYELNIMDGVYGTVMAWA